VLKKRSSRINQLNSNTNIMLTSAGE